MHGIDLVLSREKLSLEKSSIIHELYMALTSFLVDSSTGENRSSIMQSLCILLTLYLEKNGSVKQKSSIMHELYFLSKSFLGEACTNDNRSSISSHYSWY